MGPERLPSEIAQVVQRLDFTLGGRSRIPEAEMLLNRTVLRGGKRLRPLLCLLTAGAIGIEPSKVSAYARAAELTHAATLAHDDVIDEADMRRSRPTLNARSSNARAVLAGDMLLARVVTEIAELGNVPIMQDLARTIGALSEGEWLQLEARGLWDIPREHLERVSRLKTASLLSWCCRAPARAGGFDQAMIDACGSFGEAIGLAFQMIDDVIDYELSSEKPYAQDLREGLVNFVTWEMLRIDPSIQRKVELGIGVEKGREPWAPGVLAEAQAKVRTRAQAELLAATSYLELVESLAERANGASTALGKGCIRALSEVVESLKVRTR